MMSSGFGYSADGKELEAALDLGAARWALVTTRRSRSSSRLPNAA